MKILILFCCAALALALPTTPPVKTQTKKHIIEVDGVEYNVEEPEPTHYLDAQYIDADLAASQGYHEHSAHHPPPPPPPPKTGYSSGGSLVSIAQGAANAAHTQLHNQPAAAHQAAYMAKNQLAQSAAQSAATAAAALAGKSIILAGLEQQHRDAHLALNGEKMQLQQAQRAAIAAQNAARQAMHQVQVIQAALNAAQATSEHAGQAAAEAAAELAAQTTMVGQAKARAQALEEALHVARVDFEATQSAANKAAAAAQTAQNNAAAAAEHAAHAAAANKPPHHPAPEGPHHKIEARIEIDHLQTQYTPQGIGLSTETEDDESYDYKTYNY